eukprot:SM000055S18234  [mRNA]  locus=s55:138225:146666:- [translate_table: standard]
MGELRRTMSRSKGGLTMKVADDLEANLDPRLPLMQDADLRDKVVLLRVDHNVVKKGKILDQYRIDCTLATMYNLIERGGRPILMTHVGRPLDKKTRTIRCDVESSVEPIVQYLQRKLRIKFAVPVFPPYGDQGIQSIDTSINHLIQDLKARRIGGIYLPNTRWFVGEEGKPEQRQRFAVELAGLADVYINDAFGSWQPHASTYDIAKLLPSYAGLCMQNELVHVRAILSPERPFVAVVAGSKYDTKIGPLKEIYKVVDQLILGGVVYNTYLCAKYGIHIAGVTQEDIELAKELVEEDKDAKKLVELPALIESDTLEGKIEGQYRRIFVKDFRPGQEYRYVLDADPSSFEEGPAVDVLAKAKTIFVNAVMGMTPHFSDGTSTMDLVIDQNTEAQKYYGGGDTLQEFKLLHPGLYHAALDNSKYYLFTGGGTVLNVIEAQDPYSLETVNMLIQNADFAIQAPTPPLRATGSLLSPSFGSYTCGRHLFDELAVCNLSLSYYQVGPLRRAVVEEVQPERVDKNIHMLEDISHGDPSLGALLWEALRTAAAAATAFLALAWRCSRRRWASAPTAAAGGGGGCDLYEGVVRHSRRRPVRHEFEYPLRNALIDLDAAPPWFVASSARHHMTADQARELAATDGRVLLLTNPVSLQYEQNPISVYYCYSKAAAVALASEKTLSCCIAEVTNTPWAERVTFCFQPGNDFVPKPLHVSPFMDMDSRWHIRATPPGKTLELAFTADHPQLGEYFYASLRTTRTDAVREPEWFLCFSTHKVALRIYWQALWLWWKGVPVVPHPKYDQGSLIYPQNVVRRHCLEKQGAVGDVPVSGGCPYRWQAMEFPRDAAFASSPVPSVAIVAAKLLEQAALPAENVHCSHPHISCGEGPLQPLPILPQPLDEA